jgi:hypothetical protein
LHAIFASEADRPRRLAFGNLFFDQAHQLFVGAKIACETLIGVVQMIL